MSLFELLVVLIVAFLVLKPEDVPHIAKKLKDCYNFFTATKAEITSYLDLSQKPSIKVDDDIDQINFYLEKIRVIRSSVNIRGSDIDARFTQQNRQGSTPTGPI